MVNYVKAIVYTAAAIWAIVLLISGQRLSSGLLRPLSTVVSIVVLLCIGFELWFWKWRILHRWFVKRPVIDGTWRAEIRSEWIDPSGNRIGPIEAYAVIRQTLTTLSVRLMTQESNSTLVGTEIVCSADGQYCLSGVYRNEPRFQERNHSQIHYGAIRLNIVTSPSEKLEGHYWTDRNTAGEMEFSARHARKFEHFQSAQAFYATLGTETV